MKRYHQVYVYSSNACKMCELVKGFFRDAGIEYIEANISRDKNAEMKMIEISGQNTTPVVELDGRVIVGFHPEIYEMMIADKSEDK